jgi:hypothetical protein
MGCFACRIETYYEGHVVLKGVDSSYFKAPVTLKKFRGQVSADSSAEIPNCNWGVVIGYKLRRWC